MRKLYTAIAMAAALGAGSGAALAQDAPGVVGTWDTAAVTDFGTFEATMTVAGGTEGYTVEIVDVVPEGGQAMPAMESTISNVAVDGSSLTFTRSLETPQGPMELSYSFTADGDTLTGEASSSFGAIPVNGTRAGGEEAE